jgi:hypothetical protein
MKFQDLVSELKDTIPGGFLVFFDPCDGVDERIGCETGTPNE